MPSVSIALATYSGGRFIREQLESFSSQMRLPDEVIVSDDGSSDETLVIVADFAKGAPFGVKILPPGDRLGFADNFFRAATACSGDLIMFSDQDDVWLPNKIERQVGAMLPDVWLSLHCSILVDEFLKPLGEFTQGIKKTRVFQPLELDPFLTGWGNTFMFRREILETIAPSFRPRQPDAIDKPLSHDQWVYTVAAAVGQVAHIHEPLILYRQHGNNAFGTAPRTLRDKVRGALNVPMERYRARAYFYDAMISIFRDLECSNRQGLGEPAKRARVKFEERLSSVNSRIRLHESDRFLERCRCFEEIYGRQFRDAATSSELILSALKDLTLGVVLKTSLRS
jgi:glycosyltransferase involved in cell wall biosynthesis